MNASQKPTIRPDNTHIAFCNRSFQAGAGLTKKFDHGQFLKNVVPPIKKLIRMGFTVIVVVCGDQSTRFAEAVDENGETPTTRALKSEFPLETTYDACEENDWRSPLLITHVVTEGWGLNAGSGEALNQGWQVAIENGCEYFAPFSSEMTLDETLIAEGLELITEQKLSVVGFYREHWQEKRQWQVPQNTLCVWDLQQLAAVNGFQAVCNGTGETITTEDRGDVLLAGMEDFYTALLIMQNSEDFAWAMVGAENPLPWDTNFEPGSTRETDHLNKVARQGYVMLAWAQKVYPLQDPETTINQFFARQYAA